MSTARKIIHIDMDAFFASIEQRQDPELKGKPVVVGGTPDSRGVVAAASYEARRYGIRSAISCAQAARLCPDAIFIKPRIAYYKEVSNEIMDIFHQFTDLVEPLSLDEAFLDVSSNKLGIRSATETAIEIRQRIFQHTQLTASAGVAPNKFLAKIASDMNKPNGLTVISPDKVEGLLLNLPVRKVPGIGRVTEQKMANLGIHTTADLQRYSQVALQQLFGKTGTWYYQLSHGVDDRPVNPDRIRKSVSVEDTFAEDSCDLAWMGEKLAQLAENLSKRLDRLQTRGRTVTLKVTYSDFEKCTRSKTLAIAACDPSTLTETSQALLSSTEAGCKPIRLLGIGVSNLECEQQVNEITAHWRQLQLPLEDELTLNRGFS